MTNDKIIGATLAFYPVLCIYASPIIINSLGLLIMYLLITPLLLSRLKGSLLGDMYLGRYFAFFLYSILITLLWRGLGSNPVISYIINGFVLLLLIHERSYLPFFLKSYIVLSVVFSAFLLLQAFALYVFKTPINGILPSISTVIDEATSLRAYDYVDVARISSVFLEPSHFALYVLPALAIVVWDIGVVVKKKLLVISLIVAAILMSTSGNGIVLSIILGGLYYFNKARGRSFLVVTALAAIVIGFGVYFASRSMVIQYTVDSFTLTELSQENGKSYYRVERGFELYADLPLFMELLGVGYRNAENACQSNAPDILYKYKVGDVIFDYFNTIAGVLIYFGVLGFCLLSLYFVSVWRKSSSYGEKALMIIMIVSCFSSSIFNTETWFIYIILTSAIIHGQYLRQLNQSKIVTR